MISIYKNYHVAYWCIGIALMTGMIIAIASIEDDDLYNIPCVNQIIHSFDEIDRNLFSKPQRV